MLTGTVAKARGEYVRTHFKNTREVAAAISGAYTIRKEGNELVGRELEMRMSAGSLDGLRPRDRSLDVGVRDGG